jgi:hypothetical protein
VTAKVHPSVKGKSSELFIISVLLGEGFKVFQPIADVEGVDCVVLGTNSRFYPIQIKGRAEFTEGDLVSVWQFQDDMFIAIHDRKTRDFWLIPAHDYKRLSNQQPEKDGTLLYRLTTRKRQPTMLDGFRGQNGLELLRSAVTARRD